MKIKILLLLMTTLLSGFSADMLAQRKVLVVYFSHSGNTRAVANYICKQTNGDIFEIKTVKPYPTDYQTVVDIAKKNRIAISALPSNILRKISTNMMSYSSAIPIGGAPIRKP